jgi:hypothetical protein
MPTTRTRTNGTTLASYSVTSLSSSANPHAAPPQKELYMPLTIQRQPREFRNHNWITLGLSPAQSRRQAYLIEHLGRWDAETDSDLIGVASRPAAILAMERELDALNSLQAPITITAEHPEMFRCTEGNITITLTVALALAPHDPLGYEPEGYRLGLQVQVGHHPVGRYAWVAPHDLRAAAASNQGSADLGEAVYRLAYQMWQVLERYHLRIGRFDGYTTR